MSTDRVSHRKAAGWWKPLVLIGAVCAVFILAGFFGVGQKLNALRDWIAAFGAWGPFVYILVYAAATVAALPGLALTVIAGALFGSIKGVMLVSLASTLGAALAFLVARYLAREAVVGLLKDNPRFQRLDELSETHGAVIVALTRLVPIFPFNVLNYGFGLTKVRFWTYVFWSWLCMLPGTVLYVVGADALVKWIAEGKVPWMLIAICLAVAVLVFFLVRSARRRLEGTHATGKPKP